MASAVYLDIAYPERLSRWKALIKWLLAVPHGIALFLYAIGAAAAGILAWFAILFTGRYPRGLFDFVANYFHWHANVGAFVYMRDEYPPFNPQYPPVSFEIPYPERSSRWKIFFKWAFTIPSAAAFVVFAVVWWVVAILAFLAVLVTGRYPRGMFDYSVKMLRWWYHLALYLYNLTDVHPGFSPQGGDGPAPRTASEPVAS